MEKENSEVDETAGRGGRPRGRGRAPPLSSGFQRSVSVSLEKQDREDEDPSTKTDEGLSATTETTGSSPKRSRSTPSHAGSSRRRRSRDRQETLEFGGREYHGEPMGAELVNSSPSVQSDFPSDYDSDESRRSPRSSRQREGVERGRGGYHGRGGEERDRSSYERGDERERGGRRGGDRGYGRGEEDRGYGRGGYDRGRGRRDEDRGYGRGDDDRGHGRGDDDRGYGRGGDDSVRGRGGDDRGRGRGGDDRVRGRGGDDRGRGRGGDDRGRGLGRGRGRVDRDRRQERLDRHDLVISKPAELTKQGHSGKKVALLSNYFVLDRRPDWCIYSYHVGYEPPEERSSVKKQLLRPHAASLGAYIFDGSTLYNCAKLTPEPMRLYSYRDPSKEKVEMTIRLVGELAPTDVMYLQFYNIVVRKCLSMMDLEELGRHFYDRHQAIRMDAQNLELWPGYKTVMRHHEQNVLLGVEVTHKVLRLDNCLNVMCSLRGGHGDFKKNVMNEIVGSIVMTHYNRKTYRVDDIDWDSNPTQTFDMNGKEVSFADYFKNRYNITIKDMKQPMLISRLKKKDYHRGLTGPIRLVPELCQMTGLTDAMRGNFQLMKALTSHLHVGPDQRVDAVRQFMHRLQRQPAIREDLDKWGLRFRDRLVEMDGRVLPREDIIFGNNKETPDDKADWTRAFRNSQMLKSINLTNWVAIVPARDAQVVEQLTKTMMNVGRGLRFSLRPPQEVIRIPDIRAQNYINAINQAMSTYQDSLQLIFSVLPNNKIDTYSAIKKRCCIDYGVPSQCFLARNANKNLMSICTKIVIQINAKLGGEPWTVAVPLKNLMVIGFDVYHCGKRKGASVGAMVASTNSTISKYYSTVSFHNSQEELSSNLCGDMTKCLYAYNKVNDTLPDRIIMYRDGVGEGQLTFVYDTELAQIKSALLTVYKAAQRDLPKFSFLVVTKKINTRIFYPDVRNHGRPVNPEPGTLVDDVITLPERYDFYLVAQCVRQGTVSPTSYNVLFDKQGLDADKIQRLTYKLTHMYYNWSGTVAVPAPCQYAHKLAYLTGLALGNPTNERLSHLLYYL